MDVVSQVSKHPRPGETVKGTDFSYIPGGKGSNQAVAAHRLGGDVSLVGKIGNDAFGKSLLDFYNTEKMNTGHIVTDENCVTGAAFVAVDETSENVIYVSGGANDKLSVQYAETISFDSESLVISTLETPLEVTEAIFKKAKESGATTILNAAPANTKASSTFPYLDYLIVNELELASFANSQPSSKKEHVLESIEKVSNGTLNVICTLGSTGVVGKVNEDTIEVSGIKVDAVDTTGAGDCFVGAFAVALSEGKEITQALEFANKAASISVQKVGAAVSMPRREDVNR